ncbi:MAG: hypothetical protein HY744_09665, partial [Deltaproteobacteria bacterium]|nr:hypothetical protein [Deltaproteobacteria bacterium]
RGLTVVQARFDPAGAGRVEGGELRASRYAWLLLEASPATELGLDAGPFGPVPERIELARRAPREARVRERGNEEALAWPLRYDEASASIALVPGPPGSGEGTVRVALDGLGGVDPARVGARLRVHLRGGVAEGALRARAGDPANLSAVVVLGDRAGTVRFDVVDGRGRVLGSELLDWRPVPKERPAPPRPPGPPPGVLAAPVAQSPALSVPWWAPSAPQGGALVLGADSVASGAAAQLRAHLVGVIEPLAVEARLGTNALGEPRPTDAGAWLGARWRAFELGRPLELGPALRLGLPTSSTSAPARLELGGAAGGSHGRWTWLGDVGARFALQDDARRTAVPDGQAFIVLGGTYQAARWLRAYSLLDLHAMTYPGDDVAAVRGGLGLGLETATTVFGDLGLRLTPWEDLGGHVYGQIAVGIRSE